MDLKNHIREISDFPIPGVLFRDITTVLQSSKALKAAVDGMAQMVSDVEFDAVLGPESRGFIFGMPMSYNMGKGFVPVRKQGKLPAETQKIEYSLEYGTAVLEIHKDAVTPGKRFLLVDDLLATGGTAKAASELVSQMGGIIVAHAFFIELTELNGRDVLQGQDARALITY